MKISILFFLIFFSNSIFGQDLHEEVSRIYNFIPHKMTSDEQKALFPKLDKFFDFVKNNKDKYLESLRNELKRDDNNPYFYYDGGLLLMEISQTESDLQLVANALLKSDLNDLPPKIYLEHILRLSLKGANVINAALHILDDSTFQVFIPQHSLTLNYGEALKFILPRYQYDLYLKELISKFQQIKSVKNKITCLDLFIYANCCEADDFLLSLKTDNQQTKEIHDKIDETIKLTTVSQKVNAEEYLKYFEKRKEVLNRISDEAEYELNDLTLKMRKEYKCNKK